MIWAHEPHFRRLALLVLDDLCATVTAHIGEGVQFTITAQAHGACEKKVQLRRPVPAPTVTTLIMIAPATADCNGASPVQVDREVASRLTHLCI
jgi:hypothetical protein